MIKEAILISSTNVFIQTGAFHVINSGYIGVYRRGGAMLDSWTNPGLHFMLPFITQYDEVQVTLQSDQVRNIPCGTSSGVIIEFEKVQVVNRLRKDLAHRTIKNYTVNYDQTWIFSKIHHEINQFCSSHTLQEVLIDKFDTLDQTLRNALQVGCSQWAPGIQIIAVRVTKPRVPKKIAINYQDRQVQRTKLLIRKQQQRLMEIEAETEKQLAKLRAETQNKVSQINNQINLEEKSSNKQINSIGNQIMMIRETAIANAKRYRQQKLVQLNLKKLIPEKQIADYLNNIKSSQKTVYTTTIEGYVNGAQSLIKDRLKLVNS